MKIRKINRNYNYKNKFSFKNLFIYTTLVGSISLIPPIISDGKEMIEKEIYYLSDLEVNFEEGKINVDKEINNKEKDLRKEEILTKKYYSINEARKEKKLVALTFDDGPGPHTDRLLEILEKNNAKATFFVVGYNIDKYEEVVKKAHDNGHEIAIHGDTHKAFLKMSINSIQNEINNINQELENLQIPNSNLVRPPYGSINSKIINNLDYSFIMWSIDTRDWESKNKDKIKEELYKHIEEGSIILMHDIHKTTVDAVEEILKELKDEYEFVTVSELFEELNQELEVNQIYNKVKKLEKVEE